MLNNETVSSTKIRNALFEGNIEKANIYLDYEYFLTGEVISGNKIGRTLGFPTANIDVHHEKLIPKSGVYAVKVIIEKNEYKGMINIGTRPTVSLSSDSTVEAHVFDFQGNLYSKKIQIIFKKYIREERKFVDKEALKLQLLKDKKFAKNILD